MLLTEDEAKQRWCPMSRAGEDGANRLGRAGEHRPNCRCIASGCMVWRVWPDGRGYCGFGGEAIPMRRAAAATKETNT